jgi:hypothetical protein
MFNEKNAFVIDSTSNLTKELKNAICKKLFEMNRNKMIAYGNRFYNAFNRYNFYYCKITMPFVLDGIPTIHNYYIEHIALSEMMNEYKRNNNKFCSNKKYAFVQPKHYLFKRSKMIIALINE